MNNKFFSIFLFFLLILISFALAYDGTSNSYNNSFQIGQIYVGGNNSNYSTSLVQTIFGSGNNSNYSHSFKIISFTEPTSVPVVEEDNTGGSGGGGGGGGGGGAGTTGSYSATEFFQTVSKNKDNTLTIDSEDISFSEVSFVSKNNLIDVSIKVKRHLDYPAGLAKPKFKNYQLIEVIGTNIESSDLDEMSVTFSVNNSWLRENSVDKKHVFLMVYDNEWKKVKARFLRTTNGVQYYKADIQMFGYYSVSGEKKTAVQENIAQEIDDVNETNLVGDVINTPKVSAEDSVIDKDASLNWLWSVLRTLAILAVVSLVVFFVSRKRKTKVKVFIQNPGIAPKALLNAKEYIYEMRNLNFKDDTIKKRMLSEGWSEEQLKYLFYSFKKK